jgi:hypothetical protein
MQILRALQLTYYEKEFANSDICIFNTFDDAEHLYKRLIEIKKFRAVYIFQNDDFHKGKFNYLRSFLCKNDFNKLIKGNSYSSITIFNSDAYDGFSAYNILKKKTEVWFVEDAPMIYSYQVPSRRNIFLYKLMGLEFPVLKVNKWFFSVPEKMHRANGAHTFKLKPLNKEDKDFVSIINRVFDYTPDETINETDILIMEECFFTDGLMEKNDDFRLYKSIKDEFSSLSFTVKLHPRTKVNRFTEEFNCIEKSTIPWEVFLLNEEFENKIFLSISCTTMLSPKLLFNKEYKSIMLYKVIGDSVKRDDGAPYYNHEWIDLLSGLSNLYSNKNHICSPESETELISTMRKWID